MTDIPEQIVIATENSAKAREMRAIIARFLPKIDIVSLADLKTSIQLPDETAETFCGNATVKAEAASTALGCIALGDDSGLCVDCLGGRPGIRSRRWPGVPDTDGARNEALLNALAEAGSVDRSAQFVCCAALAGPRRTSDAVTGTCRGKILTEPKGTNGFGYDPLFEVDGFALTMAELDDVIKNTISHRARAIESLLRRCLWID